MWNAIKGLHAFVQDPAENVDVSRNLQEGFTLLCIREKWKSTHIEQIHACKESKNSVKTAIENSGTLYVDRGLHLHLQPPLLHETA